MNTKNSGARITAFVFFGLCVLFFILAWAVGSGWAWAFYIFLAAGLVALIVDHNNNKKGPRPEKEKSTPWVPPVVPTDQPPVVPPPPTTFTGPNDRDIFNKSFDETPQPPKQPSRSDVDEWYDKKYGKVNVPPPTPPPPPPPIRPKDLLKSRYELIPEELIPIEKRIKPGGMAVIKLAKDWDNGQKQVVIKKPRSDTDHSTKLNVDKLCQEADYLKKATHSNIVKFIDLFYTGNNMPNLVEEYVDGGDLLNKYKSRPADEQSAVRLVVQVLEALGYIHNSGFIHRDLNPGNIMVTGSGKIKLIDFGTVKTAGKSADTIFWKPGFQIPEVAAESYADRRSDIYGVGGTLYYLLTCERPGDIRGRDKVQLLMEKGISERIARCVDQALKLDPDLRFQTASAMLRNLTGG